MPFEELEARLRLVPGQISALRIGKRPHYSKIFPSLRRPRWKPYAKPKVRSVWSPCVELKAVQRRIHGLISDRFEPHPIAHAYVRGRGIVTNARQHVSKEWLFHIDLVDFFGSIKEKVVAESLLGVLPEFSEEDIGVIASLCCHNGFLPQGSPSSPILSNLVCFLLDQRLQELGSSLGLTVTRYSDDICFSSIDAIFPDELATVRARGAAQQIEVGAPLRCLFELYGFEINFNKVRFQSRTERQQVTGLVVNDGVNVPKEYYRVIRRSLHLWKKRGIDVAAWDFQHRFSVSKFVRSLKGLIDYIGQVTGSSDKRYRHFLMTFEELAADGRVGLHLV